MDLSGFYETCVYSLRIHVTHTNKHVFYYRHSQRYWIC